MHAVKVKTQESLNNILKEAINSVEITVKLKHGLTGLTSVYSYIYTHESEVISGVFAHGKSLEVIS